MEDFSEEFKEERRLKFAENYWKTGIHLSSLVEDSEGDANSRLALRWARRAFLFASFNMALSPRFDL